METKHILVWKINLFQLFSNHLKTQANGNEKQQKVVWNQCIKIKVENVNGS